MDRGGLVAPMLACALLVMAACGSGPVYTAAERRSGEGAAEHGHAAEP